MKENQIKKNVHFEQETMERVEGEIRNMKAQNNNFNEIAEKLPSLENNITVIDQLNKNKFIVPGLGDAGDRYMGT